jgi:hypothetical protein
MGEQPMICPWCQALFEPRPAGQGGKRQRFCGEICRTAFHRTLYAWSVEQFKAGAVTLEQLRARHGTDGRPRDAVTEHGGLIAIAGH